MSQQCEYCFKQIISLKGAYAKHIQYWSQREELPDRTTNDWSISLNPLLSLHCCEAHSSNQEYNFDRYNDPFFDDDFESNESRNNDNVDNHHNDVDFLTANASDSNGHINPTSPTNDANHRFEIMFFHLIMTHRASLAVFDDICQLVYEDTSSSEEQN